MNINDLRDIAMANAISSYEENVAKVIEEKVKDVSDEIIYDGLGSIVACQNIDSEGPRLAIASHMDEVGFIVKEIDDRGFIKLQMFGGFWSHMLAGQLFKVITTNGDTFVGLMGSKASHGLSKAMKEKVMSIDELYLDMGVSSKEELTKLGVQVGDMVVPYSEFETMGNSKYIRCKAFDNRIGVMVGIEVLKKLHNKKHAPIYFASTVQEEPGLRGARTATHLTQPDLCIAIDTTLAGDTPLNDNITSLGGGVSLSMIDSNSIAHRGLVRYVEKLAKEKNIPFQYSVFNGGGTDSGNIHKSLAGVINMTLSIPIRYMHTNHSIIHVDDVDACIDLLSELFMSMNQETFNYICGEVDTNER